MPRLLFVYGTLLFDEIQRAVVGRVLRSEPAVLPGYVCRRVRDQRYPAVYPDPESQTRGRVCFEVGPRTLHRLDHYEGDVYVRRTAVVTTEAGEPLEADVYVLADAHRRLLSDEPWDPDAFARDQLASFLRALRRGRSAGPASAPGTGR